jgi:hypothetical protein
MAPNLASALEHVFDRLDRIDVKAAVDEHGLDSFIEDSARAAAVGGAIAGFGGASTFVVGFTVDTLNLVAQHVRVTMAVVYARTGHQPRRPVELLHVLGLSLDERLPETLGLQSLAATVASAMASRLGKKLIGKVIPVAGAAIGGVANYRYIKSVARTLQEAPVTDLRRARHAVAVVDGETTA